MDQMWWAHNQATSNDDSFLGGESSSELRQTSRDAANAVQEVRILNEKIQNFELINRSIWELFKELANFTEDDLLGKVRQFRMEDGINSPQMCPNCSRPNGVKRRKCLYCDDELPVNSVFETL